MHMHMYMLNSDRAHGYTPTPVSHFHVAKPDLPFCSTFIGHAPFQDANLI